MQDLSEQKEEDLVFDIFKSVEHEIPPNQQSYDIIVFKAAEIKELKTFDENKPEENKIETKSEINQKPPTRYDLQHMFSVPQFQQPENNQRNGTNPRAFDFDEMLEKANEIEKIKKQEVKPKYNPTSFFDSLSTSTQKQDRQPQQRNQNQIDTDTFGNFYKQRQYNNNNNNNNGQRRNNGPYNNNYQNRRQQKVVYVEKQSQQPQQEQQQ
ncbi:hypothetical protein FGO68_gene17811 [Halteria grandinella]|uniref:Uncharacterized protein n=1 Tax=Halteria grandinella TaxID=5974 RepID=A0A8J8SYB8_HALGN|nr:hypothetical protein FGO68_gene17811 [Halteria grandinella]